MYRYDSSSNTLWTYLYAVRTSTRAYITVITIEPRLTSSAVLASEAGVAVAGTVEATINVALAVAVTPTTAVGVLVDYDRPSCVTG